MLKSAAAVSITIHQGGGGSGGRTRSGPDWIIYQRLRRPIEFARTSSCRPRLQLCTPSTFIKRLKLRYLINRTFSLLRILRLIWRGHDKMRDWRNYLFQFS